MSINYQFAPVVFSFKNRMRRELKGNQYKIMDTIADEVFLFQDTRLTLTKELSTRYLAGKTGICQPNIVRAVNKLEKKNFIRSIKSHIKGEGSLITIILDSTSISDNLPSDSTLISNREKSDSTLLSNQENLSIKDHQESDFSDSSLKFEQKKEKQPEEKTLKTSPCCSSPVPVNQASIEVSSQNIPAINLLCPGQTATGESEFTALGSVLPAVISAPPQVPIVPAPAPQVTAPSMEVSPSVIEKGKKVLSSKGFSKEQVQTITQRITDSMMKYNPNKPESYFIGACMKEKVKTASTGSTAPVSRQIPPGTGAPVKVQKNLYTAPEQWEKAIEENFEEILKDLMKTHPQEIYEVIQDVENSPSAKWIPSVPSIRAGYYVKEFRKKFSEV